MFQAAFGLLLWLVYFQTTEQRNTAKLPAVISSTLETWSMNEAIPEECKKLGLCETSENYPEELALNLYREMKKANIVLDSDINNASLYRLNYDRICPFVSKIWVPRIVRNFVDGAWYYVLNPTRNPIQGYKAELCAYNYNTTRIQNNECKQIILKDDYKSKCIQKYVTRTVMVIGNNDKATPISVPIPACCTCVADYKYDHEQAGQLNTKNIYVHNL